MGKKIYCGIIIQIVILFCFSIPAWSVTITGSVLNAEGSAPEAGYVVPISSTDYSFIMDPIFAVVNSDGSYELSLPADTECFLFTLTFTGEENQGYYNHGNTIDFSSLSIGSENVQKDVIVEHCHDFILEGYSSTGELLEEEDYAQMFIVDTTDNATSEFFSGSDNYMTSLATPSTCIKIGEKRVFFIQWKLPSFYNIILPIDNNGNGYTAADDGSTILHLNYEFAKTQVRRLKLNFEEYQNTGYSISDNIGQTLSSIESLLEQAYTQTDPVQKASISDQATNIALLTLEELEMQRAEQDIPKYRKGRVTLTVKDTSGNPVGAAATVNYNQSSHDFKFGTYDNYFNIGEDGFLLAKEAGLNNVTMGCYWSLLEPEQDDIKWDLIDNVFGVLPLSEMDFGLKAHPLIWFPPFETPFYLYTLDFNELNQEVYDHVSALVDRYKDEIQIWNVINEGHAREATFGLTREQITTLTKTSIRAVKDIDPEARTLINSYFDWYGESRKLQFFLNGEPDKFILSVRDYLNNLIASNVDFDIIGQQLYGGGGIGTESDWGFEENFCGIPTWDLSTISDFLDQLGIYGKPVHITEQSVPSSWETEWEAHNASWWHNPWDETTQAEFLEAFYTIAFSKERVEAITWWNFSDSNSFVVSGGLLDKNNNPKQAYNVLKTLVSSWTTKGVAVTDENGKVTIDGFAGEYMIEIMTGDLSWSGKIHIEEQKNFVIEINLDQNGIADLKDVMLAAKIFTRQNVIIPDGIIDINGDLKTGIEELIFMIQSSGKIR